MGLLEGVQGAFNERYKELAKGDKTEANAVSLLVLLAGNLYLEETNWSKRFRESLQMPNVASTESLNRTLEVAAVEPYSENGTGQIKVNGILYYQTGKGYFNPNTSSGSKGKWLGEALDRFAGVELHRIKQIGQSSVDSSYGYMNFQILSGRNMECAKRFQIVQG